MPELQKKAALEISVACNLFLNSHKTFLDCSEIEQTFIPNAFGMLKDNIKSDCEAIKLWIMYRCYIPHLLP